MPKSRQCRTLSELFGSVRPVAKHMGVLVNIMLARGLAFGVCASPAMIVEYLCLDDISPYGQPMVRIVHVIAISVGIHVG